MTENQEWLGQERILQVRFRWSTGPYLGRLLGELKETGKLWVARCPGCQRILMPPRIVCAACYTRVPEFPTGWFFVSGKGTLVDWERILYPQMDPETGELRSEPYIHGTFMLEEGIIFSHYLGPAELDETTLRPGMVVEMIVRPREERQGKLSDIHYFRVVEA
jgi:uncharacterized OB-fold protein